MSKFLLMLFLFFHFSFAQSSKKALIIAIGNYPEKNGWQKINSVNDIPLITQGIGYKPANSLMGDYQWLF
ncbi:hypothetical protein [Tamlana crocina]|uniref:Uncharacterized protein n=1 Tax=Tamlana crocina TaxID=393006 RepID=A0ABX1DH70_9FLAO|nr:hypothetical protein [Tamlana crocina]NJX16852.1 hypothetical protein [Tamlana crocina]